MDTDEDQRGYTEEMRFYRELATLLDDLRTEADSLNAEDPDQADSIKDWLGRFDDVVKSSGERDLWRMCKTRIDDILTAPLLCQQLDVRVSLIPDLRLILREYKGVLRAGLHLIENNNMSRHIGEYEVTAHGISVNGTQVRLKPQQSSLLSAFLGNRDHILTGQEIMYAVWNGDTDRYAPEKIPDKVSRLNVALRGYHSGREVIERLARTPEDVRYKLNLQIQ